MALTSQMPHALNTWLSTYPVWVQCELLSAIIIFIILHVDGVTDLHILVVCHTLVTELYAVNGKQRLFSCSLVISSLAHWLFLLLLTGYFFSCSLVISSLAHWLFLLLLTGYFFSCSLVISSLAHWLFLLLLTGYFFSCSLVISSLAHWLFILLLTGYSLAHGLFSCS